MGSIRVLEGFLSGTRLPFLFCGPLIKSRIVEERGTLAIVALLRNLVYRGCGDERFFIGFHKELLTRAP